MITDIIKRISKYYQIKYLSPFGLMIVSTQVDNFTKTLSGEEVKELIKHHRLLVLRGFEEISSAFLVDYAKTMGPLLEWEFGNVMEMKVHDSPKNYLFTHHHVPFHWDGAFHKEPRYLVFHCIEAPDKNTGGETLYTDTHLLWNHASDEEKEVWTHYQLTYKTEKLAHYGGQITVPLIQNHIDTGETILRFAEPVPTTMPNPVEVEVISIDKILAEQFIKDMTIRCYDLKYCYTHIWDKNDFLIADNFALLHARRAFKHFTPRHLRRIQIL